MNQPALYLLPLLLCGCSWLPAKIHVGDATVSAPKDAGTPAVLETRAAGETLALPAGSAVTVTKTEPIAAIAATPNAPAVAAQPAKEVTEVHLTAPTVWQKTANTVSASTGTIDQTIAAKRIDAEESRPLLYAALASLVAAGFFIWRAYPTPALICAGAAVVFFIAWKVSGVPDWLWAAGAIALAAAGFLYIGHEKGLKSKTP